MAVMNYRQLKQMAAFGTPSGWTDRVKRDAKGEINIGADTTSSAYFFGHAMAAHNRLMQLATRWQEGLTKIREPGRYGPVGRREALQDLIATVTADLTKERAAPAIEQITARRKALQKTVTTKLDGADKPDPALVAAVVAHLPMNDPLQLEEIFVDSLAKGQTLKARAIELMARDAGLGLSVDAIERHREARLDAFALTDEGAAELADMDAAYADLTLAFDTLAGEVRLEQLKLAEPDEKPSSAPGDRIKFSDGRSTQDGEVIDDAPSNAAE